MTNHRMPSGTMAFLFTDIEGSTHLWEAHRNEMAEALRIHDTILHRSIESHGGYIFKTAGDAFCAAFDRARDALEAAVQIQREIGMQQWGSAPNLSNPQRSQDDHKPSELLNLHIWNFKVLGYRMS